MLKKKNFWNDFFSCYSSSTAVHNDIKALGLVYSQADIALVLNK